MAEDPTIETTQQSAPGAKMIPNPNPVTEIFADGVAGLMGRRGVIKLELYSVIGHDADANTENRQITHRLVMPIAAVPELGKLLESMARAAKEAQDKGNSPVG